MIIIPRAVILGIGAFFVPGCGEARTTEVRPGSIETEAQENAIRLFEENRTQ